MRVAIAGAGAVGRSIARELGIGVGTVKTHVKGLMSKLDATARTHAVVVATQRGLIDAACIVGSLGGATSPISTAPKRLGSLSMKNTPASQGTGS